MSLALKAVSQWFTPTGFIQPDTPPLRKKYAKLRKAVEQELKALENGDHEAAWLKRYSEGTEA